VLLALISAAALVAMGVVWSRVGQLQDSVNTTDALAQAQKQPDAPAKDDGANDILIVGSDTRTDLQGHPLPTKVIKEDLRTDPTDGTLNTDTPDSSSPVPQRRQELRRLHPARHLRPAPTWATRRSTASSASPKNNPEQMVHSGEKDRAKIERDSDSAGRAALIQTCKASPASTSTTTPK